MAGRLSWRRRRSLGRINGNRMTSRIDGELVSSMHQPIDADAFAAGRRHAVFERAHVVLVHRVRFLVAGGPIGQLRLEAAALLDRIVELAEGVGHFEAADVELESLDRVGIVRRAASTAARPRSESRRRTSAGSAAAPTSGSKIALAILPAPAPLGISTPSFPAIARAEVQRPQLLDRHGDAQPLRRFLRRGVPQRHAGGTAPPC